MTRSLFDLAPKLTLENTDPNFRNVRETHAFTAARRLMDETFADFPDVDHSFVRELQTAGFSLRVLELALFAALRGQGHELDRTSTAPDFVLRGDTPVAIEATTTNPPQSKAPDDADTASAARRLVPDDLDAAEGEFVFQVGKALRRKLLKRDAKGRAYWEQPHVLGLPFMVALQSFHNSSALFHAISPLANYLYGRRDVATRDDDGTLVLESEAITEHRHKDKLIPSGLFALPEAEHLAAVIFINSATVSKFNRMGTERGYGPDDVAMVRFGGMYDPDPNADRPVPFAYVVGDYGPEDHETFSEGFHVLHNPWARTPVADGALVGFTEHRLQQDGRMLTTYRQPDFFASQTLILHGDHALRSARAHVARYLATQAATDS